MSLSLPRPSPQYDLFNEISARQAIEEADKANRKATADVEIGKQRLILTSPDGTRWNVTVSNLGAWVLTSL